jgi:hypothetical protein
VAAIAATSVINQHARQMRRLHSAGSTAIMPIQEGEHALSSFAGAFAEMEQSRPTSAPSMFALENSLSYVHKIHQRMMQALLTPFMEADMYTTFSAARVIPPLLGPCIDSLLLLLHTLYKKHFVMNMIRSKCRKYRMACTLRLITKYSWTMFLAAMVIKYHFLPDDESCAFFTTEESCLAQRLNFDTTQAYCTWIDPLDESIDPSREYQTPCRWQLRAWSVNAGLNMLVVMLALMGLVEAVIRVAGIEGIILTEVEPLSSFFDTKQVGVGFTTVNPTGSQSHGQTTVITEMQQERNRIDIQHRMDNLSRNRPVTSPTVGMGGSLSPSAMAASRPLSANAHPMVVSHRAKTAGSLVSNSIGRNLHTAPTIGRNTSQSAAAARVSKSNHVMTSQVGGTTFEFFEAKSSRSHAPRGPPRSAVIDPFNGQVDPYAYLSIESVGMGVTPSLANYIEPLEERQARQRDFEETLFNHFLKQFHYFQHSHWLHHQALQGAFERQWSVDNALLLSFNPSFQQLIQESRAYSMKRHPSMAVMALPPLPEHTLSIDFQNKAIIRQELSEVYYTKLVFEDHFLTLESIEDKDRLESRLWIAFLLDLLPRTSFESKVLTSLFDHALFHEFTYHPWLRWSFFMRWILCLVVFLANVTASIVSIFLIAFMPLEQQWTFVYLILLYLGIDLLVMESIEIIEYTWLLPYLLLKPLALLHAVVGEVLQRYRISQEYPLPTAATAATAAATRGGMGLNSAGGLGCLADKELDSV